VGQVLVGVAQPTSLVSEPQQRLHHRQRQQLGVGQLWGDADLRSPRAQVRTFLQRVIDPRVQCGREGVQIGVHQILQGRRGEATPIMDALRSAHADHHPLELVI
jgi:hypothetical protein